MAHYQQIPARPRASRVWLLIITHSLLISVAIFAWMRRSAPPDSSLHWDDAAREEMQAIVEERYVEPIDERRELQLFHAALNGYMNRLDPFSRYFSPAERRELDEDTSGQFGGIGVHIRRVAEGLLVTSVRVDGPADQAGIRPGETLTAADGATLTARDLADLVTMIKGEPDSVVTLEVKSGGGLVRDVAVTRGIVLLDTVPSVRFFADDEMPVAYVRLSQFSETSPGELRAGLQDGLDRGARGIVLDLRHNLGGVVKGAVEVAALFLPDESVVCTTRGRGTVKQYRCSRDPEMLPLDLPLVVLVDDESASASELLAGALQDHGRAALVGVETFGKFLVQTIIPLSHSDGAVRLTTSRYRTPRGRSAQRDVEHGIRGGLVPDVRVPLSSRDELEALELGFAMQLGPAWRGIPSEQADESWIDPQLAVALALLRGEELAGEPVPARLP